MTFATKVQREAPMVPPVEVSAPEPTIRVRIHDTSRFEWTTVIPLPEHGKRSYAIEVEFELPANAASWTTPWEQLQTFTRLDGANAVLPSDDATIDTLHRAALSLTQQLRHAGQGFERHCRAAAQGADAVEQGHTRAFLTIWLNAALRLARAARTKLTQSTALDTRLSTRERELIDELVSARLLEMLADADRVLQEVTGSRPGLAGEQAFAEVRRLLNEAVRDEVAYRTSRRFQSAEVESPASLERYVARTGQLKKHFEEVLFLDRETHLVDERVAQWTAVVAALFAGMVAFALQLVFGGRLPEASRVGSGIVVLAIIAGIAYAMRDRIEEAVRAWLTGKVYRYHAQRTSSCRVPGRRVTSRDVVVRAREWCNQTTRTLPDPLSPESGASLSATLVEYLQKGTVAWPVSLAASGAKSIRHVFRYDLSPLFPRLHDEVKRVPVIDKEGGIRFVDAPRRYRVPLVVRVRYDDQDHEERFAVVLDKRGLRRIESGGDDSDADAFGGQPRGLQDGARDDRASSSPAARTRVRRGPPGCPRARGLPGR
jgi:hypothetical protein